MVEKKAIRIDNEVSKKKMGTIKQKKNIILVIIGFIIALFGLLNYLWLWLHLVSNYHMYGPLIIFFAYMLFAVFVFWVGLAFVFYSRKKALYYTGIICGGIFIVGCIINSVLMQKFPLAYLFEK